MVCALAVLVCELVSWPYTTMGVCDDMSYILIARKVAETGHIFYNGPTTPMLGWQLYLGALFIKLFGYSLTTVRMSTLLVSMVLAFVLQRALVRANIGERNATIGALALVLSPLYLVLSVTFMSDIQGLFAIVLCLYGCLRALQAGTGAGGDCVDVFCGGGGWNLWDVATDCMAGDFGDGAVGGVAAAVAEEGACGGSGGECGGDALFMGACSGSSGSRITCRSMCSRTASMRAMQRDSWGIFFWTRRFCCFRLWRCFFQGCGRIGDGCWWLARCWVRGICFWRRIRVMCAEAFRWIRRAATGWACMGCTSS